MALRFVLLLFILVGIGLIATQDLWIPPLMNVLVPLIVPPPIGLSATGPTLTTVGTGVTLAATPSSGTAPLDVSFITYDSSPGDVVNFGDGTYRSMGIVIATCMPGAAIAASNCGPRNTNDHTYQFAGTYTATLLSASGSVLGHMTITVSNSGDANFVASPLLGQAPLSVVFSVNLPPTLATGVMIPTYTITYGDGTPKQDLTCSNKNNASCSFTESHTYTNAGSYTMQLLDDSGAALETTTIIVTSGPSQNINFVASPKSGPAPLTVLDSVVSSQDLQQDVSDPIGGDLKKYGGGDVLDLLYCTGTYPNGTCTYLGGFENYSHAGTYTHTSTLFNWSGALLGSATYAITVTPPIPIPKPNLEALPANSTN
jgi:PKD repeat protein